MQFTSARQRQAVMAKMHTARRWGKRQYRRIPKSGQVAAVTASVGAAGAAVLRPEVTHGNLKYTWVNHGPYLGAHVAGPLAGLAAQRLSDKRRRISAKEVGGAAALGAGTFFNERALLHSLGVFAPESLRGVTTTRARLALLGGHTVPLAVLGVGGIVGAQKLLKKKDSDVAKRAKKLALTGMATQAGIMGAHAVLPKPLARMAGLDPVKVSDAAWRVAKPLAVWTIPAVAGYQFWRHRQKKKKG